MFSEVYIINFKIIVFVEPDPSDLAMFQHYVECQTCGSYSEFYCNACHQRMCGNCRNEHLKNPDNTKHEVCNYKERKLKLASIPCKLHPSQLLALCCKKCQQAICALCTTKEHEGHGFLDLEEVYTKHHQMRLDQICRIRDDIIPQCRVRHKEAMNARNETKEYVELMKSIMKVQAFKIKELVDAILTENEQNLQRFELSVVQKLEDQETALNIYITQMQTLLECHNQSISCANPVEFLSKMNETTIVDFDSIPEIPKINPLVFTDGKLNKDEIRKQFGALS